MNKQDIKKSISLKVNDEINGFDNVRIVGENIESKIVSLDEAKKIASDLDLDLVEVNLKITPPVLKICNYEKLIYEMKRNEKKNKQVILPIKEIQLSVNICMHDIEIKAKQAMNFIEKGHKVKVILTMKGRELSRRDESKKSLLEFLTITENVASIESLKDDGNKSIAILKKKK